MTVDRGSKCQNHMQSEGLALVVHEELPVICRGLQYVGKVHILSMRESERAGTTSSPWTSVINLANLCGLLDLNSCQDLNR